MRVSPTKTALDVAIGAHQAEAVITLLTGPDLVDKTPIWASLNSIGQRFFTEGHFAEALTIHLKAHEFAEALFFPGNPHLITTIQRIAACYFSLGNYREARVYLRDEYEMEKDVSRRGEILQDIGFSYFNEGSYPQALNIYRQALASEKSDACKVDLFGAVALCYKNLGDQEQAEEYWDQAYLIAKSIYGEADPLTQHYKAAK